MQRSTRQSQSFAGNDFNYLANLSQEQKDRLQTTCASAASDLKATATKSSWDRAMEQAGASHRADASGNTIVKADRRDHGWGAVMRRLTGRAGDA